MEQAHEFHILQEMSRCEEILRQSKRLGLQLMRGLELEEDGKASGRALTCWPLYRTEKVSMKHRVSTVQLHIDGLGSHHQDPTVPDPKENENRSVNDELHWALQMD